MLMYNVLQLRSEFTDNGPATQALEIAVNLRKIGHHVSFCSSGGKLVDTIKNNNFNFYKIDELNYQNRNIFNTVIAAFKLKKILKNNNIDIIHTHNAVSVLIANLATIFSGSKVKIFFSVHGVEKRRNYSFRNWIYNLIKVNKFFAVSQYTKNCIVSFGVPSSKIIVTYNGVDLNRFNISKKDEYSKLIRNEFKIPLDAKIIGIVGRQDGVKGHFKLIESFQRIYDNYKNLYIILVGGGKALEKNKKLSIKLGVSDRTIFTGLRFDVEKLHASFNIYCLLSDKGFEMFPCSILESLAYSTPFVATNTTGVPETAQHGQGFICECNDIDCFVEKFKLLLDDDDLCSNMGKIGRKSTLEIFNINHVIGIINNSYFNN